MRYACQSRTAIPLDGGTLPGVIFVRPPTGRHSASLRLGLSATSLSRRGSPTIKGKPASPGISVQKSVNEVNLIICGQAPRDGNVRGRSPVHIRASVNCLGKRPVSLCKGLGGQFIYERSKPCSRPSCGLQWPYRPIPWAATRCSSVKWSILV